MNNFSANVIKDAEKHLEFAERSSADLSRRIQEISRACAIAERNVEESAAAIAASEKKLSVLASQQSETRKKLSSLYRTLIAIPSSVSSSTQLTAASDNDLVDATHKQTSRDRTVFFLSLYNSLTTTGDVSCLMRHAHFVQTGLRQAEHLHRDKDTPHSQKVDFAAEGQNPVERRSLDALMPLCMYALTGGCTDKNCCFQHLENSSSSSKKTNKCRNWRSLKLQIYLKQNIFSVAMNCLSNCHDSRDCHEYQYAHISGTSGGMTAKTGSSSASVLKKRYFGSMTNDGDSETGQHLSHLEEHTSVSASAEKSSSSHRKLQLRQRDCELCLSHCSHLWASCQVKSVCRCIYKCLQIESNLLPFCSQLNDSIETLPPSLQGFASSVKEQNEINALYANVVFLLVTGDFLGDWVLGVPRGEDGESGDKGERLDMNMYVLSSSRKEVVIEKLRSLLDHAPQFFEKIVCLLQQAHDAMLTDCELKYATSTAHKPISFSYSCQTSGISRGSVDVSVEVEENEYYGGVDVANGSSAHQVIWLCTSLVAEVCLSSRTGGMIREDESSNESNAILVNLCAEAGKASCTGRYLHKCSFESDTITKDIHCGESSSFLISKHIPNINFQSISTALVLNSLSKCVVEDISKQLTQSNNTESNLAISDGLVLSVLINSYLYRQIDFETFLIHFLTIYNRMHALHIPSAYDDKGPCIIFTYRGSRWMLSTAMSNCSADRNSISFNIGNSFCYFILLPTEPQSFHHDSESENDSDDSNCCDGSVSESSSDYSEGTCSEEGSVRKNSVLSDIELLHMLQEIIADIFSIHVQSFSKTSGEYRIKGNVDVDVVVGIWMCIAKLLSSHDTQAQIATPSSCTDVSRGSLTNNFKIMKRFFCNALVIQKKYILELSHSIEDVFSINVNDADVVGAMIMRMLFAFSHDRIQHMFSSDHQMVTDDNYHGVCELLLLVITVIAMTHYTYLRGKKVILDSLSPPSPLLNIFQSTLCTVLEELRFKKLLTLKHVEYLLYVIKKGSEINTGMLMDPVKEVLRDFLEVFPIQHPHLLSGCFSSLLTCDILDICFEMLNEETLGNNCPFYQLSSNTHAIERTCLKYAQYLTPHDLMPSLHSTRPDTLFQLAMVFFIAEEYESLMIIQRILLDKKHPVALFNAARVLCVCFESDSLLFQTEVMSAMLDERNTKGAEDGSECVGAKRRRMDVSWTSFQPDGVPLLRHYSVDALITLSENILPSSPASSLQQAQNNITLDMTNFTTNAIAPACLTVLAENSHPPVVNLNMSHNNFAIFPLVILDITALLRLDLSWNMLSSMPSGIDNLPHLQVLNISHNHFVYFPSSVLKLKDSLLELYLQDNKLEEIRNDFLKLTHLQVLDVRNNRLKNIPSRLNSHMKLKFFRFSGNPVFDTFTTSPQPLAHALHGRSSGVLKFSSSGRLRRNVHKSRTKRRGNRKNVHARTR